MSSAIRFHIVLFLFLAACAGKQPADRSAKPVAKPSPPRELSPAEIAERTLPSVVLIETPQGLGSGFVVWPDGRIATNFHVIAQASSAKITLPDGRVFTDVRVMAADQKRDLAIIKVAARDLPTLELAETSSVKPGAPVIAIGHPMGLGNTISDGLVSAVRVIDETLTLLQITAPIAQGSSGGPVLDSRGYVIGVAVGYAAEGQNLNFAMPAEYLKPMLLSETETPLSELPRLVALSLLRDCAPANVERIVATLVAVVKEGAPVFNSGDHQGCYNLYLQAAQKLVAEVPKCAEIKSVLQLGMGRAEQAADASAKAWALRFSFDHILNAVGLLLQKQGAAEPGA